MHRGVVTPSTQGRDSRGLGLALLALSVALIAQSEVGAGRPANGLALYLTAGALYLYSRPRAFPEEAEAAGPSASTPPLPREARDQAVLWLLSAAILGAAVLRLFSLRTGSPVPWLVYLLSLGALFGAAATLRLHESSLGEKPRPWEWAALALILAWGAFMRLYRLDSFPSGIYYDEAVNAMEAMRAVADRYFPPYFAGDLGFYGRFGALYEYFVAALLSLGGTNEIALRLTAVFPGMLALPFFYLLARRFLASPVALAAALMLAASRWHANFSRIAFDAVMVPTLLTACLLFLLWALRRGRRSGYVLSGLCLGLGLLTYTAFRLVPVVLLGAIALHVLGRRVSLREAIIGLAMLTVAAVTAATPVIYHARTDPESFGERTRRLSLVGDRTLWEAREDILRNTVRHLGMFNFQGDRNGRHNLPGLPMLHPLVGALFLLGVAACLAAYREPRSWLLLGWLLVMLAGGIFSVAFEAPQSLRSIGALPAVYLIAALPLADLWGRWRCTFGGRRWPLLIAPLVVAGGWLLGGNYLTFFMRQARDFASWNAFSTPETLMGYAIRDYGPGWEVYVDPLLSRQPTVRFLVPWFEEPDPFVPSELLPLRGTGPRGTLVFVGEQHLALANLIPHWYPEAEVVLHRNPSDGHVTLFQYVLDPEDIERTQGLEMEGTWPGEPIGAVVTPTLEYTLDPDAPLPGSLSWTGVLLAPTDGLYRFSMTAPGEGQLTLDGGIILSLQSSAAEAVAATTEVRLARGRHDLRATVRPEGPGAVSLRWRPPGESDEKVIPEEYLFHAPVQAGGLQGDYFAGAGDDWEIPTFSRVDPWVNEYVHMLPLPRPYRVRWQGWLVPPTPGEYTFSLHARDRAELWLNGMPVLSADDPENPALLPIRLTGPVPIEVRFWDETRFTYIYLRWERPDGILEVVPLTALRPPVAERLAAP